MTSGTQAKQKAELLAKGQVPGSFGFFLLMDHQHGLSESQPPLAAITALINVAKDLLLEKNQHPASHEL